MRIAFYIGHTLSFCGRNVFDRQVYGSEISLVRLAECLSRLNIQVYIFGKDLEENDCVDWMGVSYRNSKEIYEYGKFDVFVVWRYVHFFREFDFGFLSKKVVVWVHDIIFHDLWNGNKLPEYGSREIKRARNKLLYIVPVSNTHKDMIQKIYPFIDPQLYRVIPNAVGDDLVSLAENIPTKKVENSFVWTSSHSRGLTKVLNLWPKITENIPGATLSVYGEGKRTEMEGVSWFGKLGQRELFVEMLHHDIWFYPTDFIETFCCCALEAQLAGCLVVCSNIGALKETVGDRGVLLDPNEDTLEQLLLAVENKKHYQEKGKIWAKTQTWSKAALVWRKILSE